jgi:hypothetical protein
MSIVLKVYYHDYLLCLLISIFQVFFSWKLLMQNIKLKITLCLFFLNIEVNCTVLQLYSITIIQYYNYTVLQLYSITIIQYYNCTVLQLYSITIIQPCIEKSSLYSITIIQPCIEKSSLYSITIIQPCIEKSSLVKWKSCLLRCRWLLKRGSIHMNFFMTGKEKGDLLIQVTVQ